MEAGNDSNYSTSSHYPCLDELFRDELAFTLIVIIYMFKHAQSMRYPNVVPALFIARTNRFIAIVDIDGETETVHVRNTGRCKEILIPGTKVFLVESDNPDRKTRYDLISAYKGELLINIDTSAPNKVFGEYISESNLFGEDAMVFPERKHGDSRFDFYVESGDRRIFAEVKGVTLEEDGVCRFPDAPTERGLKHLRELKECVQEGYEAYVVFVVQVKGMKVFTPNYDTHPEFGMTLKEVEKAGVRVLVLGCTVTEDSLEIDGVQIPVSYR